jgi:two-component system OmpR family response regulator
MAPENAAPTQAKLAHADGRPIRALVVDDEVTLSELLQMALRYEGWDVRTAPDGQQALKVAREFDPDVIVLDIMMPDVDGLEVIRRLRADGRNMPVLFLSAKDSVDDRITGLTAGGDDYVTKPFSLEEVVARLRGLIRRSVLLLGEVESPELQVGDLVLNEESYEVYRAGSRIDLTATEFELLRFLMRNAKRVVSKAQILDRVWSYDFGGRASIVEIYISYLRKKLDALGEPMIHTVRGVGYMIKPAG